MTQEYEDDISIERCIHDGENPYAQISRALIRDEKLHPTTRFILIHLLSNSKDWKINVKQFINLLKPHGIGRDKVYFFFNQACEVGYLKRESYVTNGLKRIKYILSERPKFKKCLPRPAVQDAADPDTEEKDYKKENVFKNKKKKEKESLISFGEFVKLTQVQYDHFVSQESKGFIDDVIDDINNYVESQGKKYTSFSGAVKTFIKKKKEWDSEKSKTKVQLSKHEIDKRWHKAKEAIRELKEKGMEPLELGIRSIKTGIVAPYDSDKYPKFLRYIKMEKLL